MSQKKFTEAILQRFGMQDSKPISTPMDANCKLMKPENLDIEKMDSIPYQNVIGSLKYLATSTRPDIAYAVSALSQFNSNYNDEHWIAGKRVLRYLKGTTTHGLVFKRTEEEIKCFVDADWGGCTNDRRSYTGDVIKFANAAVSWEAKKQRTVALSSTEAEYMAMAEATKEIIYMRTFLNEIGIPLKKIGIFNDNQGAQKLVKNPIFHSRTKHIDIHHHFIRDAFEREVITLHYMPSEEMPADVLTKGLFELKHISCIKEIGIQPIS